MKRGLKQNCTIAYITAVAASSSLTAKSCLSQHASIECSCMQETLGVSKFEGFQTSRSEDLGQVDSMCEAWHDFQHTTTRKSIPNM